MKLKDLNKMLLILRIYSKDQTDHPADIKILKMELLLLLEELLRIKETEVASKFKLMKRQRIN